MQSYKIFANNQLVEIKKLDTNEYEFSAVRNHTEYFGKSYLKGLAFITDFKNYLKASSKQIEFLDNEKCIMVQLPLPFSDKFELVELKKVESVEFKKLNVTIKKTTEYLEKEINSLKIKLEQSADHIKALENNLHKALENNSYKAQKKYYFIGNIFHQSAHVTNKKHLEIMLKIADEEHLRKYPERHIVPAHLLNLCEYLDIMSKLGFKITSNSHIQETHHGNGSSYKGTLEYVVGKKWNGVVEFYDSDEMCALYGDRLSKGAKLVNFRISGYNYGPGGIIRTFMYY